MHAQTGAPAPEPCEAAMLRVCSPWRAPPPCTVPCAARRMDARRRAVVVAKSSRDSPSGEWLLRRTDKRQSLAIPLKGASLALACSAAHVGWAFAAQALASAEIRSALPGVCLLPRAAVLVLRRSASHGVTEKRWLPQAKARSAS